MFDKVFRELIDLGVLKKSKYCYMVDNQGDYIYTVKSGYKRMLKNILTDKGFTVIRIKEDKVDLIYKDNYFIGCIE